MAEGLLTQVTPEGLVACVGVFMLTQQIAIDEASATECAYMLFEGIQLTPVT